MLLMLLHVQVTIRAKQLLGLGKVTRSQQLRSMFITVMQGITGESRVAAETPDVQLSPAQGYTGVRGIDFSQWLLQNIRQDDQVYLQIDIAGAEYMIIEQMIIDGSILLVDEISVVWHDDMQAFRAGWPSLCEDILKKLGLQIKSFKPRQQPSYSKALLQFV